MPRKHEAKLHKINKWTKDIHPTEKYHLGCYIYDLKLKHGMQAQKVRYWFY